MNTFSIKVRRAIGTGPIVRDERGLSTVEYVIILVLIAAAAIGSWRTLGGKITDKLSTANTQMDNVDIKPDK